MSIHRPKRATTRRADPGETSKGGSASATKAPKWKDVVESQPDEAFAKYNPAKTFAMNALVMHPKFGKGIVVEVDGNKMQLLFEEGTKKLMHGGAI
jgi:hypothetical protein